MKRVMPFLLTGVLAILAASAISRTAVAEEIKMVGVITKITVAADGKSAAVILKENKTGQPVDVVVTDDLTLDKFKDHRIVEGDEIRCRYEVIDGKNGSKYFRKTAGC